MYDKEFIDRVLEEEQDKRLMLQQIRREEVETWKNMTWAETHRDIEKLMKEYSRRKHKHPLFITLKAIIPDGYIGNKYTWDCYLQVTCADGVLTEMYASAAYVESIFRDSSWKESNYDKGKVNFFTKPINNPIRAKKESKSTQKPSKPKQKSNNSPLLIDILTSSETTENNQLNGIFEIDNSSLKEEKPKDTLLEIFQFSSKELYNDELNF